MKITIQKRLSRNPIFLTLMILTALFTNKSFAQPTITEVGSASICLDREIPLCPSSCSAASITDLVCLNADQFEGNTLGDGEMMTAIVWTGASSSNGNVYHEGLMVGGPDLYTAAHRAYASLPSGIDYADVAIGYYRDAGHGNAQVYNAAVVYEDNGDIYLEVYTINNIYSTSPSLSLIGSARSITSSHGDAHTPHIDFRADNTYASGWGTNGDIDMSEFSITWYETNSGTDEVYYVSGDLQNLQSSYTTGHTYVGDGTYPDIALGGYEPDMVNMTTGYDRTFVTYIDDNNDWALYYDLGGITGGSTTPGSPEILEVYNTDFDDIHPPRIEAMLLGHYADYSNAFCHVVASLDPSGGSTLYKVKGYSAAFNYTPPVPGPTSVSLNLQTVDITDDFYTNSDHTLLPTVCGTLPVYGVTGIDESVGAENYQVMFYSEYTLHNNEEPNNTGLDDGDFVSVAVRPDGSSLNGDFKEVNYYDLSNGFNTSTLPVSAIATCSNTGYGLFAVWYDGDIVNSKFTITSGNWKPGKPSDVEEINGVTCYAYPNPVTNVLKVGNVTNASYMVTSMLGQTLLNGTLSKGNNTIATDKLPAGNYILTITEDNKPYRIKIVKQ